jgi:flagellar assembly protein FliH
LAKALISAEIATTAPFAGYLPAVSDDEVHANAPTAKKVVGRTADALQRLSEDAKAEGFEEGFQRGLIEGRQAGQQQIEDEMRQLVDQFAGALQQKADQIFFAIRSWQEDSEARLAELAVLIASRIIAQDIRLGHDTISELTKEALAEVTHADHVRIRINPFDAPTLQACKDELFAVSRQLRDIEIVEDPEILGGCVIESDGGAIDAMISTKLDASLKAIREAA